MSVDVNGRICPEELQPVAQPIINAFDDSEAAEISWRNLQARAGAKDEFATSTDSNAKVKRAVASILLDEVNSLRGWITSFKAAVAAATTLADLKTRVAALPAMPDRTMAQAKTAFIAKIDGGTVD